MKGKKVKKYNWVLCCLANNQNINSYEDSSKFNENSKSDFSEEESESSDDSSLANKK